MIVEALLNVQSIMTGIALVTGSTSVPAQVANEARPAAPGSAQAMPGDYFDIPQDAQLKVPLGPPAGKNPRPARTILSPVLSPGGDNAIAIAQAAEKACRADGYVVAVAVTDSKGNLKAAIAPDGTRSNGVYMAMHKAVTVVGFRMSTLALRYAIEKDSSLRLRVTPNMSLLPGGMPIFKAGRFIGAVAVSGAAAHEEEHCAQVGIARLDAGH